MTTFDIPGYTIRTVIDQSPERTIFEGVENATNKVVHIKRSTGRINSNEQLARYKREKSLVERLELDMIALPLEVINLKEGPALIFEKFGDVGLKELDINLQDFLTLAIDLVKALDGLHSKGVTHSKLTPDNVLVERSSLSIKLLDLETASTLDSENPGFVNFNDLGSEVAYMAPEQSGRMNRKVDSRSNLYSAGCIFYELLTRKKVFEYKSVVDLVYSHLARTPENPSQYNSNIPRILDQIVLKLLNKNAEDRYQSSSGLMYDLEQCLEQLSTNGKIEEFPLASRDISKDFSFPQKIYGRDKEKEKLLQKFEEVSNGEFQLLMITGYSGIGKTTLINELHKSILSKEGYFVNGKHDQLKKSTPFHALTSGLKDLINLILSAPISSSEEQINKIKKALDGQGKLLIEVLPNLELLIGPQPDLPALPIAESQNRFLDVLCRFVGAFASKNKPLTIFIDDLQWADLSTLKFIEKICSFEKNNNILFIGAYRDNEVSSTDPLMVTLSDLKSGGLAIDEINVKPLSEEDLNLLVSDTLRKEPKTTLELSKTISKLTGSNPFFIKMFMLNLYEEKYLSIDPVSSEWQWEVDKIKNVDVTSNVIDLMVQKLLKSPHESLEILKIAACIGNKFDMVQLRHVTGLTPYEIAQYLWQPLSDNFINPCDESYKTVGEGDENDYYLNAEYKFAHDRVQQATYGLISDEEKRKLHLQIGSKLLEHLNKVELEEKLFNVLTHFNHSLKILPSLELKETIRKLNFRAANKAKEAAAFSMAANFFEIGIELFNENSWVEKEDEIISAHIDLAECKYICGEYDAADSLYEMLLKKTQKPQYVARVYDIMLRQYAQQGRNKKTLELGSKVLRSYGISFKSEPSLIYLAPKLISTKISLLGKDPSRFVHFPEITDEDKSYALQTLLNISATAYVYDMNTMLLLVLRMIKISMQYGNGAESAFGYGLYGFVEGAALGNAEQSKKFADLSVKLCDNLTDPIVIAKVNFLRAFSTQHWFEPIKLANPVLKDSFKILDQSGSYTFAAYCLQAAMAKRMYLGEPLDTYYKDIIEYSLYADKVQEYYTKNLLFVLRRYCTQLSGLSHEGFKSDLDELDESKFVQELTERRLLMPVAWYYVYEMMNYFHFGEFEKSERYLSKGKLVDKVAPTTMAQIEYHFYSVLVLSKKLEKSNAFERRILISRIRSKISKLGKWSKSCSENFECRFLLAQAVLATALKKEASKIQNYFSSAHNHAEQQDNNFMLGLINELWAQYLFSVNKSREASKKIDASLNYYSLNGTSNKVSYLSKLHGIEIEESSTDQSNESSSLSEVIDIEAILKSSRVISGEIVLDKLLSSLLDILIENVGGQRGFLILAEDGNLSVEAKKEVQTQPSEAVKNTPIERSMQLSKSVVNYTYQSGESLLIDDAQINEQFQNDNYLVNNNVRSILCAPIINQGNVIAIIYIENNSAANVFSPDRLHLTEMLASQAAISIQNAKLYNTLEQKVLDRTEQLAKEKALTEELLEDVKAQKHEAEIQKVRAEKSEAFKQQFLANMSHEIRTPMNAVMGMTNLVLDTELNKVQKDYLSKVKKASDNLLHIINDILDLSKIEAGKMELEEIDFSITELVDQVKSTLQHKAEAKGLEILTSVNVTNNVVIGDPIRLNQVLINLAGNAIKFTEKGSVSIEVSESANKLYFEIIDTGIGIPKEKINAVFENFGQANTSDTRKYGGTGLGLSISQQLVDLMGGRIQIESEVDRGSNFYFTLDLKEGNRERYEKRLDGDQNVDGKILNGLTIIVADDNEYNRIVARDTLLSKSDVKIFEATNGQEAIDLLDDSVDLILMDAQMPVLNGYDATRHIRSLENSSLNNVPIVALTASVIRTDLDKCKDAGMNGYIPKPFKAHELIIGIAEVLDIELKFQNEKENLTMDDRPSVRNDNATNLDYLREFCDGDEDKMQKYINLFLNSSSKFISELELFVSNNDVESIANHVHGFNTKLTMMGMKSSKTKSVKIENCLRREGSLAEVSELIQELIKDVQNGSAELANWKG